MNAIKPEPISITTLHSRKPAHIIPGNQPGNPPLQ